MAKYLIHDARDNTAFTGDTPSDLIGKIARINDCRVAPSVSIRGFRPHPMHGYTAEWAAAERYQDQVRSIIQWIKQGIFPGLSFYKLAE